MAQLISWLQGSWHEVDGNEMKPEDVHYYMAFGGTGQNALQSDDVLNAQFDDLA